MRKLLIVAAMAAAVVGCHADPDDYVGQSEELADAVRRQNAISNLHRVYSKSLADKGGKRNDPEVVKVADAIVGPLTTTFIEHPEDGQNRLGILNLLQEMRDPRSLPALMEALDWRTEVSEEHAISAAQTLAYMEIPKAEKPKVVDALSKALEKVTGTRPVDNRMRVQFLRTLGSTGDPSATPILTKIATNQSEAQNFLINKLAAQQLGALGDPTAVATMVKCLFLFAPENLNLRMNDVAAEGLVRIGKPSLEPLLHVLKGDHDEANAIAKTLIAAVKEVNPGAAAGLTTQMITGAEASFALGALGLREALDPLIGETQSSDWRRKLNGAIAIVRLNLNDSDLPRVREVLLRVYNEMPDGSTADGIQARGQLIGAIRHLYDDGMFDFFSTIVRNEDAHADLRISAARAYALLANKADAANLRGIIASTKSSEDGGYREKFAENEPLLKAAEACDSDVGCWAGKLDDGDKEIVVKAAYMLGRFAHGNNKAIDALVTKLDHAEIDVRLAVVVALDKVAKQGSDAAVEKIDKLQREEEGRAVWSAFSREALPIQARLRARKG